MCSGAWGLAPESWRRRMDKLREIERKRKEAYAWSMAALRCS